MGLCDKLEGWDDEVGGSRGKGYIHTLEGLMLKLKLQYSGHLMGRNDSLEGLMLKLKLQYFGHLMGRTDSLEKTLMLGKIESRRRRG